MTTIVSAGQYYAGHHCGYCGSSDSCIFGFSAVAMTVEHYQMLMDRGFRRSGAFLYKPDLRNSCCPQYTIRLRANAFKPSKEHRQAINRFNRYILGPDCAIPKSKEFELRSAIHCAEYSSLPQRERDKAAHNFVVRLDRPQCTDEKYELYRHYQQYCHLEPEHKITRAGFINFLCKAPFGTESSERRSGLWHQLYYIDGELVAMAVLDFLPDTISGVYFMCKQAYSSFELGKISACREIALSLEHEKEYYHIGLYIHSCQKMKYKASFKPSELLDPETYEYYAFDRFAVELDKTKYVSFNTSPRVGPGDYDLNGIDPTMPGLQPLDHLELSNVRLLIQSYSFTAQELKQLHPAIFDILLPHILEMGAVLGTCLLEQFVLYFAS